MDLAAAPAPAPRPRGRPRKSAEARDDGNRRRALLRAAARLFHRRGFEATTTRDIAAAVGMRSGSPFYHFGSKGEMLFAVMEAGMQSAIEQQAAALRRQGDAAADAHARLACLVRNHFDVLLGAGSDFIPVMLYEARSLTKAQRRAIAELQAVYEAPWLPVFEALHREGRLRGDLKLARLLIFGALNWSAQWYRPARGGASLDVLARAALDLFVAEHAPRGRER